MVPVRQLLTSTKLTCRQEIAAKEEGKAQGSEDGATVTVEVAGETLPKLSKQEELQV